MRSIYGGCLLFYVVRFFFLELTNSFFHSVICTKKGSYRQAEKISSDDDENYQTTMGWGGVGRRGGAGAGCGHGGCSGSGSDIERKKKEKKRNEKRVFITKVGLEKQGGTLSLLLEKWRSFELKISGGDLIESMKDIETVKERTP